MLSYRPNSKHQTSGPAHLHRRSTFNSDLPNRHLWIALVVSLLMFSGCSRWAENAAQPTPAPTPVSTAAPASNSPPPAADSPPALDASLILWAPPFFTQSNAARSILEASYDRFARSHGGTNVVVYSKAESGRAGLFPFLQSAAQTAPGILPDVVVLEGRDLWQAATAGLIQPLTAEEEASLQHTIGEPTLQSARYQGILYGVPWTRDLEHLVYRSGSIPEPPSTWADLLEQGVPYLFAAGSSDGQSNDFLLAQYLGAGGTLDADGRLQDEDVLARVFAFLRQAWDAGLIPPGALNLASSESVWSLFAGDAIPMAHVPASLYASHRQEFPQFAYGPMPTETGMDSALLRTWNIAVVTTDPQKRALALDLLRDLLAPEVQGPWSRAATRLPSQNEAFSYWDERDPYVRFLRSQLENVVLPPSGSVFADTLRTLHQAERLLLNNSLAPEEAIQDLIP